ncbi:MAG: aldo/keto reductase [Bdellovibrionota bacterium]
MKSTTIKNIEKPFSQFGFGCANFGGIGSVRELVGKGNSKEEAFDLLDRAYDLGIRFFDVANTYACGEAEKILGQWLAQKSNNVRDQLIISTKVGSPVTADPNSGGLSAPHIEEQIQRSLDRLGISHVDIYFIHIPDAKTPQKETLEALTKCIEEKKTKSIGASNITVDYLKESWHISQTHNLANYQVVQNRCSLLHTTDLHELMPFCIKHNIAYTPHSPLCGGLLTGKYKNLDDFGPNTRLGLRRQWYDEYLTAKNFEKLQALQAIARTTGHSMAALALSWLMSIESMTTPICGPKTLEQFEVVEESLKLDFDQEIKDRIQAIFLKFSLDKPSVVSFTLQLLWSLFL